MQTKQWTRLLPYRTAAMAGLSLNTDANPSGGQATLSLKHQCLLAYQFSFLPEMREICHEKPPDTCETSPPCIPHRLEATSAFQKMRLSRCRVSVSRGRRILGCREVSRCNSPCPTPSLHGRGNRGPQKGRRRASGTMTHGEISSIMTIRDT